MINLTEQEGLRKLLSIEQFNRQAHIAHEPGIAGRLIKWLFGGHKTLTDDNASRKLSDSDVQILRELEVGTEIGLRREEWDDYRVMIVDQRLRVHPIPGINALTKEMEQVTLDINVAYKVFDVNYVAFGVDDPLALLQNTVIENALNYIGNLPLKELSHSDAEIAKELQQVGRIVECGLEVVDARVNIVLPKDLVDRITRTNRVLRDAESMLLERETNARINERISKIDFESELRTLQNQQSVQKIKDMYAWERENESDRENLVQRKIHEASRREELNDEMHHLDILKMKFDIFTKIFIDVGINPKLAIMIMSVDNWQRFFDRFQRLASVGEDHRDEQLKTIHNHINDLIGSGQLTEDNIQKMLGYFEDEAKHLGTNPPIMKQFEAFLWSSEASDTSHQLSESTREKSNVGTKHADTTSKAPDKDQDGKLEINLKQILDEISKKFFKLKIAHPKLISKRFESMFLIQFYFEELETKVKLKISEVIGTNSGEHNYDTELKIGQVIKVKLFSPDITFPEAITKKLDSSLNSTTFLGKPLDSCYPGKHAIVLSILDNETDIELQSETFSVKVVDFAFDHVSRPLLSRVSAVVLGIGSFAMFILTFLEQIDKTVGFTSGTAAGVLALGIYASFYNLYQRVRPSTP